LGEKFLEKCGEKFGEVAKTKEESKQLSPEKSMSSKDTRESAASSIYAKEGDFLPDFIRKRKYSDDSEKADKQLWEDIRKEGKNTGGSFLYEKFLKYIFIDTETRKAYVQMPSIFHQKVVKKLKSIVSRVGDGVVLVETDGGIDLTNGSTKEPDIYIFGQDRTESDRDGDLQCRLHRFNDGREPEEMNPNAIIKVSWTNKIDDELEKFALQMNHCNSDELGAINLGYLIKFIPKREYPTKTNRKRPLVGIDVYRMERTQEMQTGENIAAPIPDEPFLRWHHGKKVYSLGNLKLTGEELGQGTQGEGLSIPFGMIVDKLTELGVVFEKPDKNANKNDTKPIFKDSSILCNAKNVENKKS